MAAKLLSRKLVLSVIAALLYFGGRSIGFTGYDMLNVALCLLSYVVTEGAVDFARALAARRPAVEDGARNDKLRQALTEEVRKKWGNQ